VAVTTSRRQRSFSLFSWWPSKRLPLDAPPKRRRALGPFADVVQGVAVTPPAMRFRFYRRTRRLLPSPRMWQNPQGILTLIAHCWNISIETPATKHSASFEKTSSQIPPSIAAARKATRQEAPTSNKGHRPPVASGSSPRQMEVRWRRASGGSQNPCYNNSGRFFRFPKSRGRRLSGSASLRYIIRHVDRRNVLRSF